MPSIFAGTCGIENVNDIYDLMEANCSIPIGSKSKELWKLRRACRISPCNPSNEKRLEKAVAMLAEREHMPEWFNQCPVASGIVDSDSNKHNSVDLVYWTGLSGGARLVELKWGKPTTRSNPRTALRQLLRYGVAYLFCRVHRAELPLHGQNYRPLMDASHVALEVAAPTKFYDGHEAKDRYAQVSKSLNCFARAKTSGALTMSLSAFSFPVWFDHIPFEDGQDVMDKCDTIELSNEGRMVRNAFEGLSPVWPDSKI